MLFICLLILRTYRTDALSSFKLKLMFLQIFFSKKVFQFLFNIRYKPEERLSNITRPKFSEFEDE